MSSSHPSHTFTNPPGLYDPRPNGYTHVVEATTPARLVYVAGQGGENQLGELSPDFAEQMRQALANLRTALAAATLIPVPRLALLGMLFEIEATAVTYQANEVW
jgi:enamine deaminase RidA (YjgF/YER057c/UK114 family)